MRVLRYICSGVSSVEGAKEDLQTGSLLGRLITTLEWSCLGKHQGKCMVFLCGKHWRELGEACPHSPFMMQERGGLGIICL